LHWNQGDTRSVFFYRFGEIRDRNFESQRYRASGLNLVTTAIVLWNIVDLERAVQAMHVRGMQPDAGLLPYLSPLGWEHINLTGDYVWRQSQKLQAGKFRPLRPLPEAGVACFPSCLRRDLISLFLASVASVMLGASACSDSA
jgi:hypothetical protein